MFSVCRFQFLKNTYIDSLNLSHFNCLYCFFYGAAIPGTAKLVVIEQLELRI